MHIVMFAPPYSAKSWSELSYELPISQPVRNTNTPPTIT